MPPRTQSLKFQQLVKTKPSLAYKAFTNSTSLREWFCDVATVDPRPGGRFYAAWSDGYYASGEYLETVPHKRVSFSWHGRGDPRPSRVSIRLSKAEGGTLVSVEHSRLGTNPRWAQVVEEVKKGWTYALENLPSVLETGEDRRFTLRPMLGVMVDAFNAEVARELGVPVSEGLRLSDAVEGMGARAAGLQADDVIVSMGGLDYARWGSVANVLQSHRAGDRIEVEFYRGGEKKSTTMELSRRPLPQIPSQPEQLADALRQRDARIFQEMEELFTGVSEDEAGHKPASDEWSAKEVLAHLIHEQRGSISFINDLLGEYEPLYDGFGPNTDARVRATVETNPTLSGLISEYKRNAAETASFIQYIPASFMENKGSYWRIAYLLLGADYHFASHKEQMQAAIAHARQG